MSGLLVVLIVWWISLWLKDDEPGMSQLPDIDMSTTADSLIQTAQEDSVVVSTASVEIMTEPEDVPVEMDHFRQAVGAAGYCLHVFSLVDSLLAETQLDDMAELGITGIIRSKEVDGRIWYRIYTGSFGSIVQCRDAMPELFERLEIDWAMPTSYRRLEQQ